MAVVKTRVVGVAVTEPLALLEPDFEALPEAEDEGAVEATVTPASLQMEAKAEKAAEAAASEEPQAEDRIEGICLLLQMLETWIGFCWVLWGAVR